MMTGCAVSQPSAWSSGGLINHQDGIVTVWRKAEYAGGEFNGFDRNERFIDKARYRAFAIIEVNRRLQTSELPVDFVYRSEDGGTAAPDFRIEKGRVVAVSCDDSKQQPCLPVSSIPQLGRRNEDLIVAGATLTIAPVSGRPQCRLDLSLAAFEVIPEGADESLAAAYHPNEGILYLVRTKAHGFELFYSKDCAPLERISVDTDLASAFSGQIADLRDLRIRDVASNGNPARPAVLFDWTVQADGVFRERAGVLELANSEHHLLPIDSPRPIGFWCGSGKEVLMDADIQISNGIGRLALKLYSPETQLLRTLQTTAALN